MLQASVGEAEGRMESLAAKDKNVTQLNQRVDALAKHYQELFTQSDELNKKQEALESLHTRLEQVDELSKRTNSQLVALNQSRRDLETLRKEIVDFHKSYAEAAQLRDKLGSDRAALEGFIERVTRSMPARRRSKPRWTPSRRSSASSRKAPRRPPASASWPASSTGSSTAWRRLQFVEQVEARINGLNGVLTDVERKLDDQLSRRAEVDTIKTQIDTWARSSATRREAGRGQRAAAQAAADDRAAVDAARRKSKRRSRA